MELEELSFRLRKELSDKSFQRDQIDACIASLKKCYQQSDTNRILSQIVSCYRDTDIDQLQPANKKWQLVCFQPYLFDPPILPEDLVAEEPTAELAFKTLYFRLRRNYSWSENPDKPPLDLIVYASHPSNYQGSKYFNWEFYRGEDIPFIANDILEFYKKGCGMFRLEEL